MLSLALSVAVLSSSGGLLSGYESSHVRLIDAVEVVGGVALGQAGYAAPQSLEGLRNHLAELEENRPSFVAPIVLLAVGGGVTIMAAIFSAILYSAPSLAVGFLAVAFWIAGPVLLVVGAIILGVTIGRSARANREINRVKTQIQQLEAGGGGYQPLPTGPTPPPPPQSQLTGPSTDLVLAAF
jgi:hypothetical protein